MYLEIIAGVGILAAVLALSGAYLILRRVKRQILEMAEVLEDVKAGNGNRRILSEPHELTAPLAYGLNEIVLSYEKQHLAYRQAEGANRQLMTSLSHDVRTPLTSPDAGQPDRLDPSPGGKTGGVHGPDPGTALVGKTGSRRVHADTQ